jgi:2-oxoisovalerate dehydrogenase E2 component (dihydrolipoyl transacylase)
MIKQNGVDPKEINPSGKNGRILKEDVINYLKKGKNENSTNMTKVAIVEEVSMAESELMKKEKEKETLSKSCGVSKTQTTSDYVSNSTLQDKVVKIEGFRKAMVKTMTQSTKIPSFLYTDELNVDKLVRLRKEMNKIDTKLKLSYMPFFIKAISYALLQYPDLNSNVNTTNEEGLLTEYIVKKDHNISIAIDTEHGLIVPNIKRVQDKSIVQIQLELNQLREKAKNQKITSEDYKDGSFTVSNIGMNKL